MSTLKRGSRIGSSFPYRIVNPLGQKQGNMSDIYLATTGSMEQLDPAKFVVLKITRVQDAHGQFYHDALDNEAECLRRLNHPGIVRILPIQHQGMKNVTFTARSGLPGNPWFSVLEYLGGGSLADLIKTHKQLDLYTALKITHAIATTLDHLHKGGQVHLDLKPENILFRDQSQSRQQLDPVLIDFGIVRHIGQAGLEAGTLQYAPPERIQGTNRANKPPEMLARPHPSMDIYALGMIAYQMVTGKLPYQGRSRKGLTSEILNGQPTVPSEYRPDISRKLNGLILGMIDKEPRNRPTSEQLVAQLPPMIQEAKGANQETLITYAATPPSSKKSRNFGRWIGLGVGSILITAVVLFGLYIVQTPSVRQSLSALVPSNPTETVAPIPTLTPTPDPSPTQKNIVVEANPTATLLDATATPQPAPTLAPAPTSTPLPDIPTPTVQPTSTPQAVLTPTVTTAPVVRNPVPVNPPPDCPDPRAILRSPGVNQTVKGIIMVQGTAKHERMDRYKIEFSPGADMNNARVWSEHVGTVNDGDLAVMDTAALSNGQWTIRLTVVDKTGNYPPPCQVTVNVQN